jgi:hypothetical protein
MLGLYKIEVLWKGRKYRMGKVTIKQKIVELAAIYNTFGLDNDISKEAEKRLVSNNVKHIIKAKELSAMARHIK